MFNVKLVGIPIPRVIADQRYLGASKQLDTEQSERLLTPVLIDSMSQNGSVYRYSVEITSCSPISTGCSSNSHVVDGPIIDLIVGGEWISCSCKVEVH